MKKNSNVIFLEEIDISISIEEEIIDEVLCYGHFNIIHPGHIRFLKYAKSLGKKLVVGLISDKSLFEEGIKNYFSEIERSEGLSHLNFVDSIIIFDLKEIEQLVLKLKPKILVLGSEHEEEADSFSTKAIDAVNSIGALTRFHAGPHNLYNSDYLNQEQSVLKLEKFKKFQSACEIQKIELKNLKQILEKINEKNLLVIGDTIVDQYIACDPLGISAEAPVVVVKEIGKKEFIGGAAIVAEHVSSLGAKCHFISVTGMDKEAKMVEKSLKERKVFPFIIRDTSRPTTFKIRYMVENQKLFRVSKLEEHKVERKIESEIISKFDSISDKLDAIILSDFSYGVLTERVIEHIKNIAKRKKILLFGDAQSSSQRGNIKKFSEFDLIFPTEKEARTSLDNTNNSVEWIANELIDSLNINNTLVKLGPDGFIAYSKVSKEYVNRQHFPSLAVNPVDVTGAGDSLLASMSCSIAAGANLMQASAIGTCVAALCVNEVGNVPVKMENVINMITDLLSKSGETNVR